VPHGRPITFVLINDDPIEHEWLIGDEAMHEKAPRGDGGTSRRSPD
jgi:hypothetical protein